MYATFPHKKLVGPI